MNETGLRVMTYNIHRGRGMDGRVDLERIAGVVESFAPDVLALQEVGAGEVDQAAALAARLGMAHGFGLCLETRRRRYGNATLTRLPVLATREVRLPHWGAERRLRSEPRCAIFTRVRWGDRTIDVCNTHLSTIRGERPDQVAAIASALGEGDLVIAGDLNCARGSSAFRALSSGLDLGPRGRGWPTPVPLRQIDHILHRGTLSLIAGGVWTAARARWASDHFPLWAELTASSADR